MQASYVRQVDGVYRAAIGIFLFSLTGCGSAAPPLTELAGAVTVDGQPLAEGTISFVPQGKDQGPSISVPIKAGRYEARVPQGAIVAYFQATRATGKMVDFFGEQQPETISVIPSAYQGGVSIEVAGDEMSHDFPLKSQTSQP